MSDLDWGAFGSGDFVKFDSIGVTVAGTVTGIRVGQDFNGHNVPVIDLDTADGPRTVTCGQANLKAQIIALRPSVGQAISIAYVKDEKAEKGMKKVFEIKAGQPSTTGDKPPF
jgi:hypothetical protein